MLMGRRGGCIVGLGLNYCMGGCDWSVSADVDADELMRLGLDGLIKTHRGLQEYSVANGTSEVGASPRLRLQGIQG